MTYNTSTCPNCGAIIQLMSSRKHSKGNPFKVCNHCGQTYYDPYCSEQALKPYKKSGKISCVFAALFAGLAVSFPALAIMVYFSNLPSKTIKIATGVLFLISFTLFLAHSLSIYEDVEENLLREWKESDARLQNPEHAAKLKLHGVDVPEKYITSEVKHLIAASEEKGKNEYDEIMKAQERYIFGKTMISYGKRDKQVKEKAAQANMDTDEFLELCKKWVFEYDELHRQYNSTHYPPIDYPN